ncbi:MAG: hypothetical protein GY794_16750, partial [bacterium]|nr:hypothetical protein [bacterium]
MACAIQRDQIAGVKPFCFASRAIKASCLIAIVVVLALFGQVAEAEDFLTYWQGPSHGDWNDPLNWTNGLPTASRAACISNGAYADVISGVAVADLVSIEDGGLRLNGTGQLDTGLLTVAKDSSSIFDLGDSATLNCSSLTVGTTAVGLFNQTGGINTITGALALSTRNGSADSTYNLSAGQLSEQSLALSATPHGRTAYFNQSGGTHHVTGDMTMVRNSRYTLSGGQFAVDGKVAIHGGTLAWYGGTLTTPEISFFGGSSYLLLGTSIDFYQLAGGVLPNGTVLTDFQYACIGVGDGSTMTHDTGVVSMGRDFLLGTAAGSYTLNVTGTAGLQTGHYVHVGFEGSGVLNLSDSTQLTTEQVHVGTDVVGSISPGHDGVVNQTGGTVEASNLLVKRGPTDGSPAYHLSGTGQLTTTGYSMIGSGTSPNPNTSTSPVATHEALFRQSGGQHTTDRLYVGRTSSNTIGAYELTGGELVAGEISVGHPSYSPFQSFPGSVGRFSQSGGVVTAGTLTVNSVSRYEFTGGTCQFDDATISGEFDFLGSSALLIFADGI